MTQNLKPATMFDNHAQRMARATAYIYDHLDGDLDLMRLAEIACFSPYHWHRLYRGLSGETLAETVRRLRLQRAAGDLSQSDLSIEVVATRAGYESAAAFNRAFKSAFGLPPARYRKTGGHIKFKRPFTPETQAMFDIKIVKKSALSVICLPHSGAYTEIGRTFGILDSLLTANNLRGHTGRMVGIYYSDPVIVPVDALCSDAGVLADDDCIVERPLVRKTLVAGDYAVLRHKGPYSDLPAAYQWLFSEWLVKSGREAADAPVYEDYFNSPQDSAPNDLITEINLPLL